MNVRFHKNCENTGKILKISFVSCNFVKFISPSSQKKFSLVLLQMTNYILSDLTMYNVEKNEICFKLFWYKVFIHRKSKLLNFLVDSVDALVT